MTAPRIPRHRPPVILAQDRQAWYETTAHRVAALIVLAAFGGLFVHGLLAWMGA